MAIQEIPKFSTKAELKSWVRAIGIKNIDPKSLKKAHKRIKKNK